MRRHNKKQTINFMFSIILISILLLYPSNALAAPVITGISPSTISNHQLNTITVTGSDFVSGSIVSLSNYGNLTTSFFSNTTLIANVPAGIPAGLYTVVVTNPDLTTATLPNALSVTSQPPAASATPTQPPPGGYERPVLVVTAYDYSQERIKPGDYFTLYVTIYNAGQHYARNVVANFTPGDLIPRETGGVIAVGEIAPGNRAEFSQPLVLSTSTWDNMVSLSMLVTYTDQAGMLYSDTFSISIPVYHVYSSQSTPTPTPTVSPTPIVKPQLVISSYSTDLTPLQPGLQFNLTLNVKNMGSSTAQRVSMIVGGGTSTSGGESGTQQPGGISGSTGEFTNFAPIDSSNVQSLGDFTPGLTITANQQLIVNTNTAPGAYPLKISFVYMDDQNHTYIDDQVITLLVYRLPSVDINFYQEVPIFYTGMPNMLPLQVINLSRNSIVLGNMRVIADAGQFSNNSILVGTLEPGGYFTLDAMYIPDFPGIVDLVVSIDYTNDFNQLQVISKTITVDVMEQEIFDPPIDGPVDGGGPDNIPQQPETFLQKVWRFILGLLGLDSGVNSQQSVDGEKPIDIPSEGEKPVIVPVAPPMKGP